MGNVDGFDTSRLLKKSIRGLFDADLSSLRSPGFARKPGFAFPGEPAQREEGPPDLPLDPLRPWSSPSGRYQVAPTLSWRNCQYAKQKAAAPAPPCARDAQGGASVAGGRMPRATGIRTSCTARFLLCFIVQTCSVFEQWRYVPIPRRAGSPSAVPYREVVMPREAGTPGAAVAQGGARAATAG